MGAGGQSHVPAALTPGKTRYPLYRTLGGPQARSGRERKPSPPPGFDSRTVQPVTSRYTGWAIAAPYRYQSEQYIISYNNRALVTTDNNSLMLTSDMQNRRGWCITHRRQATVFLEWDTFSHLHASKSLNVFTLCLLCQSYHEPSPPSTTPV